MKNQWKKLKTLLGAKPAALITIIQEVSLKERRTDVPSDKPFIYKSTSCGVVVK